MGANFQSFQAPVEGEPKDDLKAHEASQAKKEEQQPTNERPSWLPEKFNSPEDLAKSYLELEQKLSQDKQTPKQEPTSQDKATEKINEVDFNAVIEEASKNEGKLSEETYNKLKEKGISKEVVDFSVKGYFQEVAAEEKAITDRAGGKDQYDVMVDWAANAMSKAEIDAFNKAVNEGSVNEALLAVDGLKARYETVNGKIPKLVNGDQTPSNVAGYESRAEMISDMASPQYKTDPAFRAKVAEKIKASKIM